MSQSEARAWWADVEHLRDSIDARRQSEGQRRRTAATPTAASDVPRRTVQITGRGAPAPVTRPRPLVEVQRRRPASRTVDRAAYRPDRLAMWAVLLGLALVLIATTSASAATNLGDRTLHVPMQGRDVRMLQSELQGLGLLSARATAYYGPMTRTAVRRYQRSRCLEADGIAGPATIESLRSGAVPCASGGAGSDDPALRRRVVTWYGPGLFGRRTACGDRLTRRLRGVAHRTLPCGTRVRFVRGGRAVVARVVDRGPHVAGVHYDLTWAAARDLGVLGAGRASVSASR